MEIELLHILGERQVWEKYQDVVKANARYLSEASRIIVRVLPEYYALSGDNTINWGSFASWYKLTKQQTHHSGDVELLVGKVASHTGNSEVQADIIRALVERRVAEEVIEIAEDISTGGNRFCVEDLQRKLQELAKLDIDHTGSPNIVTDDMKELLGAVLDGGLNWKQLWMNQSCGPLRKGDFVVLVARPDSGKTSFLSGQANSFAKQSDKPVLWVNNEQEGRKVKLRIIQEAVGMPNADIKLHPERARSQYEDTIGPLGSVVVVDKAGITAGEITALCEQYGPCAVIIDQLWKVKGFGSDNSDVKVQTQVANWARELCKKHAPVIGVYQADTNAEGREYFGMECIYMSKTAVQGEADLIICMGRSYEEGRQNSRFFHFPKNKMAGGGQFYQSHMRGFKHESVFEPGTGKFS